MLNNNFLNKKNIIYSFILLSSLFVMFQSLFGICFADESFYIAEAQRLFQGQKLLIDDYNGAQFYTPILFPFFSVFFKITKTTDGILLAARLVKTLITCIVGIYMFFSLKKIYTMLLAFSSFFIFIFYTKDAIRGLSYYALAVDLYLLAVLFLYNSKNKSNSIFYFCAGIFFGLSIICNPFILLFYLVASFILLCAFFATKKKFHFTSVILVWCGTVLVGGIYVFYCFHFSDLPELISSVQSIFNTVEGDGLFVKTAYFFIRIMRPFVLTGIIPLFTVVFQLFFLLSKKECINNRYKYTLFFLNFIVFLYSCFIRTNIPGFFCIPLFYFGIVCMFLQANDFSFFKSSVFLYFALPGIFLAIAFYYASNTGTNAATIGFLVTVPFSLYYIFLFVSNMMSHKVQLAVKAVVLLTAFTLSVYQKFFIIFTDDSVFELNTKITQGPWKGCYTSKTHKNIYDEILADINYINETASLEDSLFVAPMLPWGYIAFKGKINSPNLWEIYLDDQNLKRFFDTHDLPEYVYIVLSTEQERKYHLFRMSYNSESEINGWFYDDVLSRFYTEYRLKKGILFKIANK